MAIIGKIREKSWLMLVLVGGALLAFILGDYYKGSGGNDMEFGYGTVYGEMVNIDEFNSQLAIAEENTRRNAEQQGQQPEPVDRDAVWSSFVESIVLEKQYEALGINVSDAEFESYLYGRDGFKVLPDLAQGFTDSITGMFNDKLLQSRIEEMESSDDPNVQKQWADSKEYYTKRRMQEKYFEILNQGVYVTNLEAKNEYLAQKEVKSISYVFKRYSEIKDESIPTPDAKLRAFFEEHKAEKKYENKQSSREIKFFDIFIEPSKKDSNDFNKTMAELKAKFATTKNDSLFVMKNSDMKGFSSTHLATFKSDKDEKARQGMTYPSYMDTIFKSAKIGDIVGPYEDNGNTRIAKILDFNKNSLTSRHILIAAQKSDDAAVKKAKKLVDSLLPLINTSNFEEYVTRFTEDPGSKDKGGKYEDFMDYEMVPEFSKFATDEPIGKIGYVQTDFGFHIMENIERKEINAPVLAIVQKTLKPSIETIDSKDKEVYDMLFELDEKLSKKTDLYAKVVLFDTIVSRADKFARPVTIMDDAPKLFGFTSKFAEDKLLQLAYKEGAQVGDLVSSPIKDKNRYIIAILSAIKTKGTPTFEDAQVAIKRDYIEDVKAKRITAQMAGVKSLKELSSKLKVEVQKAEITFANPQITGAGYEPEVVGALFSGLKDGARSLPLKGKSGVYVVQIEQTTKAPAAANYMVEKDQLLSSAKNSAQGAARGALLKQAEVIDNRRFFENNIRR